MRGEAFYQALAREPGHSPVLESPGDEHDRIMQVYRGNQAIHRRPVLVTEYYWLGFDMSKLDFANMVALDMKAFLGSRADHLVVHRDLYGEYEERYGSIQAQLRNRAEPTRRQARTVTEGLTQTWGPPDYSDDAISAWNLRRVRRAVISGK